MKSMSFRPFFLPFLVGVLALFVSLPGCGGGTTGTGSSSSTDFTGRLLDANGNGVPGTTVVFETESGEVAATNTGADGSYSASIELQTDEPVTITVLAATASFKPSVVNGTVTADLQLSADKKEVEVIEAPTPEPTPQPDPDPDPGPSPTPSPKPTTGPSPTATAIPEPSKLTVTGNVEEGTPGVLENAKVMVVGRAMTRTTLKPNGNFTMTTNSNRTQIGFRLDSRAGTGKAFIENLPEGIVKIKVRLRAEASGERLVVNLSVKGATAVLKDGSEVPL